MQMVLESKPLLLNGLRLIGNRFAGNEDDMKYKSPGAMGVDAISAMAFFVRFSPPEICNTKQPGWFCAGNQTLRLFLTWELLKKTAVKKAIGM
jgi:hypothetical protein